MGQKVHPYGLRLGVIRTWTSLWYQDRNYAKWLHEDLKIRGLVKNKLYHAGIAKVVMAMEDPNPLVSGKGCALLRRSGIDVHSGLLGTEARALNIGFVNLLISRFVTSKWDSIEVSNRGFIDIDRHQ